VKQGIHSGPSKTWTDAPSSDLELTFAHKGELNFSYTCLWYKTPHALTLINAGIVIQCNCHFRNRVSTESEKVSSPVTMVGVCNYSKTYMAYVTYLNSHCTANIFHDYGYTTTGLKRIRQHRGYGHLFPRDPERSARGPGSRPRGWQMRDGADTPRACRLSVSHPRRHRAHSCDCYADDPRCGGPGPQRVPPRSVL